MTQVEEKEIRNEQLREFLALKTIFGGLLLESKQADNNDIAYYQRKFREAQRAVEAHK